MKNLQISPINSLKGEITLPGDKSISHRSIMIASLAEGETKIHHFLYSEDSIKTIKAFKAMGIKIYENKNKELIIIGKGLQGLREPRYILNCGNSGTTLRLISGILAGQNFLSVLTGDTSLRTRPLKRIIIPLRAMGGNLYARQNNELLPLVIRGGGLKAITYSLPVPSAQVKSSLLLAGLFADGTTKITEPMKSRDHTERMLKTFGAKIEENNLEVSLKGKQILKRAELFIPGDISSAAFFIVGATILKKSHLVILNIGLNKTRIGILEALKKMGADITIKNEKVINNEKIGDLEIRSSKLHGIELKGEIIPKIIDEIPILCVAASLAKGETLIRDAKELRVKETDRISALANNLRNLGIKVKELEDGLKITGGEKLTGKKVLSFGDHRIAMAMIIAGLSSSQKLTVENTKCIDTSFPNFFKTLKKIIM